MGDGNCALPVSYSFYCGCADNVEFGAEATHGGIMPVILGDGSGQAWSHPFRVQFARGLPRTTADDSCWHDTGRFLVSLTAARRSVADGL